jgi:hypothetical protein
VSNEHEAPTYRKFLRRTRRFSSSFTKPSVMSGEMLKQDIVRNLDRLSPESLRDVKAFIGGVEKTCAEESSSALLAAAGCLFGEPLSAEEIEEALYPIRT